MTIYKKFMLFGDSITEFACRPDRCTMGSALSDIYTRKFDIVFRGYSGYTTRWAIPILEDILKEEDNIAMATIFFGSNDSCLGGTQAVPLSEFIANTKKLISMMKKKCIKPILVGPALINTTLWDSTKSEDVKNGYIRTQENFSRYNDSLKEVAKDENIPFVDLESTFTLHGGDKWQELLVDGLHFSGEGYKLFYNELLNVIHESYPEYHPDNLIMKYPLWREVKADGSNLLN